MSKQVNFFLHPDDENQLIEYTLSENDVGFIHLPITSDRDFVKKQFDPSQGKGRWLAFHMILETHIHKLVLEPLKNGQWFLDTHVSPVIQFSRSYFDGRILRRGRSYFQTSYYDANDEKVRLPDDFIKWGDRLLKWIRKNYRRDDDGFYLSPSAVAFKERGGQLTQL